MKSRYRNLIIIVLIILVIILSAKLILKNVEIVTQNKQITKEMTEGEYESKLTELNKSHEDYALEVQKYKKQIADAITKEGVTTSENDTASVMANNIEGILAARTSDATATSGDIIEGATAYVNGNLIIGTGENLVSNKEFQLLWTSSSETGTAGTKFSIDLDLSNYKYIIVEFIYGTYGHLSYQIAFEKDVVYKAQNYHDHANGNVHYRTYYWNDTGVHFVEYSHKERCNPIRIYGL